MIPDDFTQYNTIDNLPVETSTRRAQDMESATVPLADAPQIAGRAQVDVTTPAYPTQASVLTGSRARNKPFPDFFPPPGYNTRTMNFTHLVIPSLGDTERLGSLKDKLQSLSNLSEPENGAVGKLTAFLSTMGSLTNILQDVIGSMRQFTRG